MIIIVEKHCAERMLSNSFISDLYSQLIKQNKTLKTIFNLLDLYLMLKQNHCKYLKACMR